jgi:similar to spore coat protein
VEEYIYVFISKKSGGETMKQEHLAPSETMQIHEMLNFKTICMTTSKMMEGVVFDQDLKALLEKDVQQSITAISSLQNLLKKSPKIR